MTHEPISRRAPERLTALRTVVDPLRPHRSDHPPTDQALTKVEFHGRLLGAVERVERRSVDIDAEIRSASRPTREQGRAVLLRFGAGNRDYAS